MHILDKRRIKLAAKAQGYSSIGDLAQAIGVHRNTLQRYFSSAGIFPHSIEILFEKLKINPSEALVQLSNQPSIDETSNEISNFVDDLSKAYPQFTFILFGSRTNSKSRKNSDWDIGVYRKGGLSHSEFVEFLVDAKDRAEKLSHLVDIVNLNRASPDFLTSVIRTGRLLAGRMSDWSLLKKEASCVI